MPRVNEVRQRYHQPRYDHVARGIGISSVTNNLLLFNRAAQDRALTNMPVPGQLASDSTFYLLAVRSFMYFQSTNDAEFDTAFGSVQAVTNTTGTNSRAEDLYSLVAYGCTFSLKIASKDFLQAPVWYAPAGGGVTGSTTQNSRTALTNGWASHTSILKLGRPIAIPARQNFSITVDFYPFLRLGAGQGGTIGADIDVLTNFNQFDGIKVFGFMVDGLETRDVL